ncbi:MAG: hypothetical protein H0W87_01460 [Actinobacteria bacterium]|nr:hypothetical protein [Actinomycetota bacterium]
MRRAPAVAAATTVAVAGTIVSLVAPASGRDETAHMRKAAATVGTITLSPQAIALPNPASRGGRGTARPRIPVSLSVLDSQG